LGRSHGRFGTKFHGSVDARGDFTGFILINAERSDISQAVTLLEKASGDKAVIADKRRL